jgi:hypothetical protein
MRKRTSVCLLMAVVLYASQVWSDTLSTKEECVMKCHEAAALINSKKLSYIYRVPGHDIFVGAGVYVGGMLY